MPTVSGRKAVEIFRSFGWKVARQRGSHIILVKDGQQATLSVPHHKQVAKGTLASLLRAAGISADEFTRAA